MSTRFKKGDKGHWKGGRTKNDAGYIMIYSPNHPFAVNKRYVREHRLVMEKKIGRYLRKDELVHHINGDITDNRIENLQLMTKAEHQKHHISKDVSDRICVKCGSDKTYVGKTGYARWYKLDDDWTCQKCHYKLYWLMKSYSS